MSNDPEILISAYGVRGDSDLCGFLLVSPKLSGPRLFKIASVDDVPQLEIISAINRVPFVPSEDSEYIVSLLMRHQQQPAYFVAAIGNDTFGGGTFGGDLF